MPEAARISDKVETTEEAPVKEARIVSPKERTATVELDWPIEFDGKTWNEVTIGRVTGKEVDEYLTAVLGGDTRTMLPVVKCPVEVYDALDDDDRFRVEEAALPFLPRRLREAAKSLESTPGDTSEPTSGQ